MSINARFGTLSYGLTLVVALALVLLVVSRLVWLAISGSLGDGSWLSTVLLSIAVLAFTFPAIRAVLRLKSGRPLIPQVGERPIHIWSAMALASASVGHVILLAIAAAIFTSTQSEREEIGMIALPLMIVVALYVIALWVGEYIAFAREN